MNKRMFDAFSEREKQVTEYMAGCGMKYGMDCTCGPDCRCRSCPLHEEEQKMRQLSIEPNSFLAPMGITSSFDYATSLQRGHGVGSSSNDRQQKPTSNLRFNTFNQQNAGADLGLNSYGIGAASSTVTGLNSYGVGAASSTVAFNQNVEGMYSMNDTASENQQHQDHLTPLLFDSNQQNVILPNQQRRVSRVRNHSALSYGNRSSMRDGNRSSLRDGNRSSLRGMSITSETTFGRAMSGLSALSIDWENLDDFDLDVDHSAHINQVGVPNGGVAGGARRSSATRRSIMSTGSQDGGNGSQVSFQV